MGIVLGKPANYKAVSASAVRRIVNKEINARTAKRNTRSKNRPNTRRNEPEEEPEEELPEEFKEAMRDAGLDPNDPADVKKFLKRLNQDGGRRRRGNKRK